MKNFSNTYIFLYAGGLVVLVAALLSFASVQLQPLQKENIRKKKMQNILSSVNIESTAADAGEKYARFITETFVVNTKGEVVKGDAFTISMKRQMKNAPEDRLLPVFVCTKNEYAKSYIVPVTGKGLGGPIWGFIALEGDFTTIVGTTFDHDAETPGLGAKITLKEFQTSFIGKKIFDDSRTFKSIALLKGGKAAGNPHVVDAISGGTITSGGVDDMLKACLINYVTYFNNNSK